MCLLPVGAKAKIKGEGVCVCLLLVRAKAKIKGNKYGATRSAGDYRRLVRTGFLLFFTIVGGFYSEVALRNEKQRAQCILDTS